MSPSCESEYSAGFRGFAEASGARLADLANRLELLAPQLALAEQQLETCRGRQGRYFDIQLKMHDYMVSTGFTLEPKQGTPFDRVLPFGLCAPPQCADQLGEVVVPRFLGYVLQVNHSMGVATPEVLRAHELASWQEISLDFAILGINRCGTTSLHFNLGQHPEIAFMRPDGEDTFLFRHKSILPRREDVEVFGSRYETHGTHGLLGYRHSGLYSNARLLHGLQRVRHLRGILILCEPMGRLERFFLVDHMWRCYGNEATAAKYRPGPMELKDRPPRCWRSVAEALEDVAGGFLSEEHRRQLQTNPEAMKHPLLERYHFGQLLPGLLELFGDRLLLLHQDALAEAPRQTYDRLARFLGAAPFPADARFPRRNVLSGPRTDLCDNASLVHHFKRLLEPEYQAIEEALVMTGEAIPRDLRARRAGRDIKPRAESSLVIPISAMAISNKKLQKIMTLPINQIFRYLQNRSRVQVWLHEQADLRIEGRILGFDEYMNLVIDDAEEIMVKKKTRRAIGRILLKGDNICLMMNTGA
ncbi:unnamed protein product [Effrenium voratum]|uniref:Probable small nuclear ribonucleoprotein E n=1 Tax=Effrenium voratum TaxID=2562239 RepID=A0AA36I856_9DINO|nr:unnamed protein product [Effrenium voratum]